MNQGLSEDFSAQITIIRYALLAVLDELRVCEGDCHAPTTVRRCKIKKKIVLFQSAPSYLRSSMSHYHQQQKFFVQKDIA